MSLIDSLERKYRHLAIPHLIAGIAILQGLVWILMRISPATLLHLLFVKEAIVFNYEYWRLISWVFVPDETMAGGYGFFMLVAVYFMLFISRGLEEAWGSFRITLYVIGGVVLIDLLSIFLNAIPTTIALDCTFLLAFAYFLGDLEVLAMFIVPVKMRYIAWLSAAYVGYLALKNPGPLRMGMLVCFVPYLIAFGPRLWKQLLQESANAERRTRFSAAASRADEEPHFHKCASCGKTDVEDPHLEFRVAADGEEYCSKCRPVAKSKS